MNKKMAKRIPTRRLLIAAIPLRSRLKSAPVQGRVSQVDVNTFHLLHGTW